MKNLAKDMKAAVAALKQQYDPSALNAEIARANVNAQKVSAFTQELKEANQEVEAFLGETNSNFPSSDTPKKTDVNGVTLNQEIQK